MSDKLPNVVSSIKQNTNRL